MTAFDTNILIYAYNKADPLRQRIATELLKAHRDDGVLLWQVACEFIAASRKLCPQGLSTEQAWNYLARQLRLFPLVVPSIEVLKRARDLHVSSGFSFWDALIFAACLDAGVEQIYSEDLPGGSLPDLRIVNPFGPS